MCLSSNKLFKRIRFSPSSPSSFDSSRLACKCAVPRELFHLQPRQRKHQEVGKVVYVGSRNFLPPIVTVSVSKVRPFLGVCLSQTTVALRILNRFRPFFRKSFAHRTAQMIGTNMTRSEHGEGPKIAKMTLKKIIKVCQQFSLAF